MVQGQEEGALDGKILGPGGEKGEKGNSEGAGEAALAYFESSFCLTHPSSLHRGLLTQ